MMDSATADSFVAADYGALLRRRWRVIFTCTAIGTLAAVGYIVAAQKSYTATASVYVTSNAANTAQVLGSKTTTVINMDNEAQIVTSTSVASVAARTLHSTQTLRDLLQQISVSVPANTQILQISCSASTARQSAVCAQAFANAYLTTRQNTAAFKIQSQIKSDRARLKVLESKSVSLQQQIASLRTGSTAFAAAHQRLTDVVSQINPLRVTISALLASNNYQAGYIPTAATPPTSPSSPRKLLYGPGGLMAGLLIGLILAFTADRSDDRIHAAQDVERFLRTPVVLELGEPDPSLWSGVAPVSSPSGREFGELARATAVTLGDGAHALLVVGAGSSALTSVVAANLAASLARSRAGVVLVCSTPRSRAPALLGIGAGGRGFADLTSPNLATTEVAQQSSAVAGLRVVAPTGDPELLENVPYEAGRRAMTRLKTDAHYVIIDGGSAADGITGLAEFADAAIVVAEIESTRLSEFADCLRRLNRIQTQVLGAAVLARSNRATARAARRMAKAVPEHRPASRWDDAEPAAQGTRNRAASSAPSAQPARPENPAWSSGSELPPARPGARRREFERPTAPGQSPDLATSREPRSVSPPWPLPAAPQSAADDRAGSQRKHGYPAEFPPTPAPDA